MPPINLNLKLNFQQSYRARRVVFYSPKYTSFFPSIRRYWHNFQAPSLFVNAKGIQSAYIKSTSHPNHTIFSIWPTLYFANELFCKWKFSLLIFMRSSAQKLVVKKMRHCTVYTAQTDLLVHGTGKVAIPSTEAVEIKAVSGFTVHVHEISNLS